MIFFEWLDTVAAILLAALTIQTFVMTFDNSNAKYVSGARAFSLTFLFITFISLMLSLHPMILVAGYISSWTFFGSIGSCIFWCTRWLALTRFTTNCHVCSDKSRHYHPSKDRIVFAPRTAEESYLSEIEASDRISDDWCTVKRSDVPFSVFTVCPNGHSGTHFLERSGDGQVARTCRECAVRWAEAV